MVGMRITGTTHEILCVEIKDKDLLESSLKVIWFGECGIFSPMRRMGSFAHKSLIPDPAKITNG